MTVEENTPVVDFSEFALIEPVQKALVDVGYHSPTPIQSLAIPLILEGLDIVGQAQTGTGKTAAFALPILSRIDRTSRNVQVLVLTPTRELAIQVADNFKKYSAHIEGLKVLPIYGGQEYGIQLRALRKGVQVVIGTPGRVMDHMRRGTLKLDNLSCLVLDEADEMLRMGFIDDVEWILEKTPSTRQTALFSATMPRPIRTIAKRHLNQPQEIIIETRTTAAQSIAQRFLVVPGARKMNALVRILEMEEFDAVLVFTKTRAATVTVAEKLVAQGHAACALNGDLAQSVRERTVNKLKSGKLNIIVATDVAARGLDVDRISHVINFDAPNDAETYVHRIGRTGRAGRNGEALLFMAPHEKKLFHNIKYATRQSIEPMEIPSVDAINEKRLQKFKDRITATLEQKDISFFRDLIESYYRENDVPEIDVAAAVAHILQGKAPLLLREEQVNKKAKSRNPFPSDQSRPGMNTSRSKPDRGMERYRIEVGDKHGVQPSNIVGAIANEAGLASRYIGRINIFETYSTVDLPEGMPRDILRLLKRVWVCSTQLRISREGDQKKKKLDNAPMRDTKRKAKKPKKKKLAKSKKGKKNRTYKSIRKTAA